MQTQVQFGADFASDVGMAAGEDCEQLFSYMYRHAPTTKHMSQVGERCCAACMRMSGMLCTLPFALLAAVNVLQAPLML